MNTHHTVILGTTTISVTTLIQPKHHPVSQSLPHEAQLASKSIPHDISC
jgi:hypothetical protein